MIINTIGIMTEIGNKVQKRLAGEIRDLNRNKMDFAQAVQDERNPLTFYFMLRPKDKPYVGGLYVGKISLPKDYPDNPGEFYMLTPNGRFEVNKKICLTNSNYHKESWVPLWSIRNMILGFISIFIADDTTGISHIKESNETRLFKATNSHAYNLANHKDITLKFDQFVKEDGTQKTDAEVLEYIKPAETAKKIEIPDQTLISLPKMIEETNIGMSSSDATMENKPIKIQKEIIPAEIIKENEPVAILNENNPTEVVKNIVPSEIIKNNPIEVVEKIIPTEIIKNNPIEVVEKIIPTEIIKENESIQTVEMNNKYSFEHMSVAELIDTLSLMNLSTYDSKIVATIDFKLKPVENVLQFETAVKVIKKVKGLNTNKYKQNSDIDRLSKMTIDTYDRKLVDTILKNK